ncbi:MAG: hypothetical protein Q8Q32_01395 [bacterium]|nr:hypothetical protein [bacterium]
MEKIKEIDMATAVSEVMAISQQAEQMGRQDFEPSAFKEIIHKLTVTKEISPTQAIEEARQLVESKQHDADMDHRLDR